jgi:archaemetzincin
VQPLGEFSAIQRKIISLTADFMGRYFGLPVIVKDDLPLSIIPAGARRTHPAWGDRQILTSYVLSHVLGPRLPRDAVAYIAFTTSDLWPGPGWNFVFGQASLRDRVGIWSIYRNGDPEAGPAAFRLCLLRTMKTASHEMGHMFSMLHCTAYECNMCGSNHREESDRRPIACCPDCVAKIWWATGADPVERYRNLADFCREHGLSTEQEFYRRSIQALESK